MATHVLIAIKENGMIDTDVVLTDPRKCECKDCNLANRIHEFFPDLSECQRAVIDELWNRMECAEMDLAYETAIRDGSWPVMTITGLNNFAAQILMEI